jgi:hypothetical protein
MNGLEIAEGLRKLNPKMGVVMVSGYACERNLEEVSFLRKPFSIEALLTASATVPGGGDRGPHSPSHSRSERRCNG